jgi:hypothetical protein
LKLSLLFWAALIVVLNFQSQSQCFTGELPFQPGESITYEAAYNWGILWVNAGEVRFRTYAVPGGSGQLMHFEATGSSYKYYDWFFRVRDSYQSVVNVQDFKPEYVKTHIREGGYEAQNAYYFRHDPWLVYTEHTGSQGKKCDTLEVPECTLDVISAAYYVRCLNLDTLEPGDKIPLKLIIGGGYYELFIRYLGREQVTNRSGKKYSCHKLSALVVEGTIFKGGEDLTVWVTADKNKIPVMAEAKILVGSVKAYLTSYEGLKLPLEAY